MNYNKFLNATNCVNLEFHLNAKGCLYFALAELVIKQKLRKFCRKSEENNVLRQIRGTRFLQVCVYVNSYLGSVKDTGAGRRINVLTVNVWINIFMVYLYISNTTGYIYFFRGLLSFIKLKIPHTGDKASLDRCG